MTRRFLAAVSFALVAAGIAASTAAAPVANAASDSRVCVGGSNQQKPGASQGICVGVGGGGG